MILTRTALRQQSCSERGSGCRTKSKFTYFLDATTAEGKMRSILLSPVAPTRVEINVILRNLALVKRVFFGST